MDHQKNFTMSVAIMSRYTKRALRLCPEKNDEKKNSGSKRLTGKMFKIGC